MLQIIVCLAVGRARREQKAKTEEVARWHE